MSAARIYVLSCDAPSRCDRSHTSGDGLLTATRADAARNGWAYVLRTKRQGVAPSLDFCPAHAAQVARPWCTVCASVDIDIDGGRCNLCGSAIGARRSASETQEECTHAD